MADVPEPERCQDMYQRPGYESARIGLIINPHERKVQNQFNCSDSLLSFPSFVLLAAAVPQIDLNVHVSDISRRRR